MNGLILRSQTGEWKKEYQYIKGINHIAGNPKFIG
jgi:hypothetical protein